MNTWSFERHAEVARAVIVGTVVANTYRVDRVIARGGMGVIAAATHLELGKPVALKFLVPEMANDRQVVERFTHEARMAARLRGEHVCRVFDLGALDDGLPFIVMELLEGCDLASVIHRGPLSIQDATDLVLQACLGVAEAHALGLVHRDLKPANLFLTRRPDGGLHLKVLDFGIVKARFESDFRLTRTSSIVGSPGYMSPEQLRSSHDVDHRSDIWALGVTLYELVSGRLPFVDESITAIALRIVMDPSPPLPVSVPAAFAAVVDRCLAKDPSRRFADVASFADALAPFGGSDARGLAKDVSRMYDSRRHAEAPTVIAPIGLDRTDEITIVQASRTAAVTVPIATSSSGATRSFRIIAALTILAAAVAGFVLALGNDDVQPATPPTPGALPVDVLPPLIQDATPFDAVIASRSRGPSYRRVDDRGR